ncbi:hypothetical protein OH76DRAFT_1556239 [Lentinus brumalis]|uniref:MYND-type domain-containing protein n=1 Tax=Lentinus brumalis TaxID=2498619 RepID=A0A371DBA4_9APHY|nr:hypothetical protein OH76DRAFT_1556239 [Polyporus brumalis]
MNPTNDDATLEELYADICRIVSRIPMIGGGGDTIGRVCRRLGIRKESALTRRGLRRLHVRLPELSKKLLYVFDRARSRHQEQWTVCDTIGYIWIMLCADAVLCHDLVSARGCLLAKVLYVADMLTPSVVRVLLSLLVRNGDDATRSGVLSALPYILDKWSPWKSHQDSDEMLLITLCHCIGVDTLSAESRSPREVPVSFVAKVALDALENPDSRTSYDLVIHAIPLLVSCAQTCPPEERETRTRILDFLAVLLHSRDVALRCVAVWVFCGLPAVERKSTFGHLSPGGTVELVDYSELLQWDPPPAHERASIQTYTAMLHKLLWELSHDGDLYQFGVGMAHVLLNGPFIYNEDHLPYPKKGALSGLDVWYSLLPGAVQVLKGREDPSHLNMADVLALKHLVITGQPDAAANYAREVLQRNSEHTYAYVILSEHSEDREEALQAARKGLGLAHLTVYLQKRLHVCAIQLSLAKAQRLLLQSGPSDWQRREAGCDGLETVQKYMRAYVTTTPGDTRDLLHTMDLSVVHLCIRQGEEYTPEQLEDRLNPFIERTKLTTHILESSGYKITEGSMRAGRRDLVHHFSRGYNKWAKFVELFDEIDEENRAFREESDSDGSADSVHSREDVPRAEGGDSHRSNDEAYARWWEPENEPTLASLLRGPLRCSCHGSEDGPRALYPGLAVLRACSSCSRRTAMVRRTCSRCKDTWYCDAQCQRAHWPEHRMVCRYRE